MKCRIVFAALVFISAHGLGISREREMSDAEKAQQAALAPLAKMDGTWRGPAWIILPNGQKEEMVQTERIGPFLGGSIKVIEGRGHDAEGKIVFNALGIISHDEKKGVTMRSYAMGRAGDYPMKITDDGYSWEISAGPATIRYTATIKDGTLHEIGERIVPGQEPMRFFEMTLQRLGDSEWPEDGAVPLE